MVRSVRRQFRGTLVLGLAGSTLMVVGGCEHLLGFERGIGGEVDGCGAEPGSSCAGGGATQTHPDAGGDSGRSSGGSNSTSGATQREDFGGAGGAEAAAAGAVGQAGQLAQAGEAGAGAVSTCDPQAPDVCDGLDNDCDGLWDLEEVGNPLAGTTSSLAIDESTSGEIDVAWSPRDSTYGLTWSGAYAYFQPMTLHGERPLPAVTLSNGDFGAATVAIEWGDWGSAGAFGVAWGDVINFRSVGADTTFISDIVVVPEDDAWGSVGPSLAWRASSATWDLFWTDYRDNTETVISRAVSPLGALDDEINFMAPANSVRVVSKGDTLAAVCNSRVDAGLGNDETELQSTGGVFLASEVYESFALSGRDPVVAAGTEGFAVVTAVADKLELFVFNDDGSRKCGPTRSASEGFVPSDIVPTVDGFLIVAGEPNVSAIEVRGDCQFGHRFNIEQERGYSVRAAAAGDQGFAVVWSVKDPLSHVTTALKTRTFGPHYCD